MIEPDRILYYFENVSVEFDPEDELDKEELKKFLRQLYMFTHLGTEELHHCRHPEWEQDFLKAEQELIAAGRMVPYADRKAESQRKEIDFLVDCC